MSTSTTTSDLLSTKSLQERYGCTPRGRALSVESLKVGEYRHSQAGLLSAREVCRDRI